MMIDNMHDVFHNLRASLNVRFDGIGVIMGTVEDRLQIDHWDAELEQTAMRRAA